MSTRAKTYTIKPLAWGQDESGDWRARSLGGTKYVIYGFRRSCWFWGFNTYNSADEAKAAAEAHWQAQIESVLEEVQPAAPEATP